MEKKYTIKAKYKNGNIKVLEESEFDNLGLVRSLAFWKMMYAEDALIEHEEVVKENKEEINPHYTILILK